MFYISPWGRGKICSTELETHCSQFFASGWLGYPLCKAGRIIVGISKGNSHISCYHVMKACFCVCIYICMYLVAHALQHHFIQPSSWFPCKQIHHQDTDYSLSIIQQSTGEVEPTEEPLNHLPPVCIVHSITCTPTTHCSLQHSCSSCLPLKNSFAYSLLQRPVFHSYSWSWHFGNADVGADLHNTSITGQEAKYSRTCSRLHQSP